MMKISLSDYIRDVLNDQESARCEDTQRREGCSEMVCPGCSGNGRYVGFRRVEDPCEVCGGSGRVPLDDGRPD
jgi:DnaJ-class molecular chaperone